MLDSMANDQFGICKVQSQVRLILSDEFMLLSTATDFGTTLPIYDTYVRRAILEDLL